MVARPPRQSESPGLTHVPGLSSLSLYSPQILIDPPDPYSPFPFQLSRLFLQLHEPSSSLLLSALLASAVSSLDELHLSALCAGSAASLPATVIAPLAARLPALCLNFYTQLPDTSALPLLAQCLRLERLEMSVRSRNSGEGPPPDFIVDAIRAVPVACLSPTSSSRPPYHR